MSCDDQQQGMPEYGQICWFEIPVFDLQRASKLYAEVFGWNCHEEAKSMGEHGVKEMNFFTSADKKFNGAFLVMQEGYQMTRYGNLQKEVLPPLATFCVKDCDETLKQVASLGGSTQCPKTPIGGEMGYFARFNDSEGNIIGVWSQH
ncbi:hypothetical protein QQS21_006301 [Conoideocrella luteorostrata]|uniref:Glyoxalase/fosfomycin resistance/dioxygenase domain-containing protein n=1 Tax=Conoideocrella luteorostrata TaxID=1105319 RepID=A0AAJ0FY48_9HYPO|nr:hypothetical protein QQS21_006301 [Conoideocrella luteorostrata]